MHQSHTNNLPNLYDAQWVQKYLQKPGNDSEDNSIEYNKIENDLKLPSINN